MPDQYTHIRYEKRDDGVAVLTLDEPERLNAIDHGPGSMADEVLDALADADADEAVRCVLLTGTGRAFSAGGDPGGRTLDDPLEWYEFLQSNVRETESIRSLRKPTIGAINGLCYGFGLILATHLDLLVAVDTARFGLIETRFGSTGAQTLPFLVGPQWAKFLALSGELISAGKAKEIGLVLEVFPEDAFWDKALDLARRVAAMPREAVMLNRRVVNGALTMMGWDGQRELSLALNTVTNLLAKNARAADGRVLADVRRDKGWKQYKEARDQAFAEPWLDT
ncbi:enoyl-CoA hydratase/isomerase family protein [Streptomyces sp. NPDC054962]